MVEAVAEGDQAFAEPMQSHLREYGAVEAMALEHRHVHVAQRPSELSGVVTFVTDDRSAGMLDGAALLFDGGQQAFVGGRGADVEDFEGLCHVSCVSRSEE